MNDSMNIGQAAEAAGVSAKMIRHYEQIGLLPAASRSDSGYRQYGGRDVSVLRFIRRSRRLGFSIKQIAELIGLWSDTQRSSREVKALTSRHLADLEQKMQEMAMMKVELQRVVDHCRGDDDPHCAILDGLALDGAAAPAAAPVIVVPSRRAAQRHQPAKAVAAATAATSHNALLAWTHHAVHARHAHAQASEHHGDH